MMKHWKFLAISDTHLGEDSSLLSYKSGRRCLFEALHSQLGGGDRFKLDELVLVGDIPDRTLSSTSQIATHTYDFMKTLMAVADVGRVVYVPGNHDHTLWTDYIKANGFAHIVSEVPEGDLLLKVGDYSQAKRAPELLSILFGYSATNPEQLWRTLATNEQLEFSFANPVYAKAHQGRTYVFAHGTHFRRDVMTSEILQKLADYLQIDRLLGGLEIESTQKLDAAVDLRDLEHRVTPFVDSLWPSSGEQPTGKSDKFWYLITSISGKFRKEKRATPAGHSLWSLAQLQQPGDAPIRRLSATDASLERLQRQFLPLLLEYLGHHQLGPQPLTLVLGDTHRGGVADISFQQQPINIFNTGAWVAHNRDDHPDCHLFAVDDAGVEHMVDVSFQGVNVGTESILARAAIESEHRKDRVGRVTRFLLESLF